MALELFLLPLILIGGFVAFRLPGADGRRARRLMLFGLISSVGGCVGSLGWLGAETSGSGGFFGQVNPLFFAALFVIGVLVMGAGAVVALSGRAKQKSE